MTIRPPQFGGTYAILRYTQNNQQVDDDKDQNRFLARFQRAYGPFDDLIENEKNGFTYRPAGAFTGLWRDESNIAVLLTDDERGDHYAQAQAVHDDATIRTEEAGLSGDTGEMSRAAFDHRDQMQAMTKDALPVELEEIDNGDGKPVFRLNVMS